MLMNSWKSKCRAFISIAFLSIPNKGDFLVDGELLFEIGGKKKSFTQIKDIQKSFLVIDDIESGFGNKIPLWLFGFLY